MMKYKREDKRGWISINYSAITLLSSYELWPRNIIDVLSIYKYNIAAFNVGF